MPSKRYVRRRNVGENPLRGPVTEGAIATIVTAGTTAINLRAAWLGRNELSQTKI